MANSKSLASILPTITYNSQNAVDIWTVIRSSKLFSSVTFYQDYNIMDTDRWDTISQKFYQTPFLWWILANYNNIKDPFKELIPGNTIRIIKPEILVQILHKLKGIT